MARTREFDEKEALAAATEVFRRQGYEAASMRELAGAMGLSASSVYAAFGDKDGLFLAAVEHAADADAALFRERLVASTDIVTGLRAVIQDLLTSLLGGEAQWVSLTFRAAVEVADRKPEILRALVPKFDGFVDGLAQRLEAAGHAGEIHLTREARDVARFLLLSIFNLYFVTRLTRAPERLDGYVDIILSVLTAPDSRPTAPRPPEGSNGQAG